MRRGRLISRKRFAGSLRLRLYFLIMLPLVLVALLAGAIRYWQAQDMSRTLYDDALKVVAHAVAREVIITQGDVVSDALLNSLVGVMGDPIFYNVSAADGRILAGYTDTPDDIIPHDLRGGEPYFFDFTYIGDPVRAVVLREFIADPFFDGWTTVLVWQTITQRRALSLVILQQALAILAVVLVTASVAVWFGITQGLRPLIDLKEAVALRSPSELNPIRRAVPNEVRPLVATMNSLFARLQAEMQRRNSFIANAAHQIRNPVAAIQTQAETALTARTEDQRQARLQDLYESASDLSRLSQQLLSLEVADHVSSENDGIVDFTSLVAGIARRFAPKALSEGIEIHLNAPEQAFCVAGNAILLREAIENLIDNSLRYGAVTDDEIRLILESDGHTVTLLVEDDGPGIPKEAAEQVFERFVRLPQQGGQKFQKSGCGLGLAIVRSVAARHGGTAYVRHSDTGCCFALVLPLALQPSDEVSPEHGSRSLCR
ncbi:sensor histidine kinase [Roseinatronobacter monicus]|uniref:histidine kinase n=1 Tax=Roseinatronobacter monicus TaxID=393481 RepID=A0A543KIH7_9RHOB|nr:sensor histidine kinase [Roseinatronobacter monicus]TQM94885.1 two-component system sensor histidine kinase TctE [Roseinatronobacter monicus]